MERKSRLAENLRAYQQERGKTLSEFAAELGVARSTFNDAPLFYIILFGYGLREEKTNRMVSSLHSRANTPLATIPSCACASAALANR